jgi:magnesium transporter
MQTVEQVARFIHNHRDEDHAKIREQLNALPSADLAEVLNALASLGEAAEMLALVPLAKAIEVCDQPILRRRAALIAQVEPELAAKLLEGVAADERADIVHRMSVYDRRRVLSLLSAEARAEAEMLLQYPENTAGDLMTTEFVRLGPAMAVGQALAYIRDVARDRETIYACYILEPGTGRLLGAVSLRDLVMADPNCPVAAVMRTNPVTASALEPRRELIHKISKYNLLAVPVLESDGRVVGFVTVDDVIDAMTQAQTDAVLRMGAVEPGALDEPYMATPFFTLVKKRATWLVILFLGEMLTATAMGHFEHEIERAVVLALFVPLIISSGGNSGSQATTLVIRALALNELRLGNWWRVMGREVLSGLALGAILGTIGVLRITLWQQLHIQDYGEHWVLVALTVGVSLVGVVLWGTLSGSMLPFLLKRVGLDPATSSAPFVATLVDVTGLVIYFTVASVILFEMFR